MELTRNRSGQGLTEYLILILLIAVVSIPAARSLGNMIKRKLQVAQRNINSNVTITPEGSTDGPADEN